MCSCAANPRRLAGIPPPLDQTAGHPLDLKPFYVTFAASVPTLNHHLSCLNYYPRGQPWKRELRSKIQFQTITREQRRTGDRSERSALVSDESPLGDYRKKLVCLTELFDGT